MKKERTGGRWNGKAGRKEVAGESRDEGLGKTLPGRSRRMKLTGGSCQVDACMMKLAGTCEEPAGKRNSGKNVLGGPRRSRDVESGRRYHESDQAQKNKTGK